MSIASGFYLYLFEFGAIMTFALILWRERKNRNVSEKIILALIYGLLLEIINVYLSKSYFYSRDFLFQINDIPFAIGAGWAIIYYCAKNTAEKYNLKWWQEPILMALVALNVDLAIDAAAIRLGFWTWKIPLNQEWFGVPYDNLMGWLAVVWTFSFLVNLSERGFLNDRLSRITKYAAAFVSPILLSLQITFYVSLSAILSGKFSAGELLRFYRNDDFSYAYYPEVQTFKAYIFAALVFILTVYIGKNVLSKRLTFQRRHGIDAPFAIFTLIHAGTFFAIISSGIYNQQPLLLLVSIATIILNFIVELLPVISKNLSKKIIL